MHRTTRHLTLTERGTVFFDQCKKILDDLDQAEKMIGEGLNKATGHLIVSAPAAFGRKHVAPHAPAFLAANPDVKISFNLSDQVVDLVREGYDLSIRIGGTIDPSLVAVNLYSNHRVVCAAPDYLEKHGLAWRSTWEIQSELASGKLVTVLDDYALPNYDIMAVYPQQRYLPLKTRLFIDHLKSTYMQADYWTQPH